MEAGDALGCTGRAGAGVVGFGSSVGLATTCVGGSECSAELLPVPGGGAPLPSAGQELGAAWTGATVVVALGVVVEEVGSLRSAATRLSIF